MKWYKLVGSTTPGLQVPPDWEHDDPATFTHIRFPWNKPPIRFSLHDEETEFFCSPLAAAPKLRNVYPEFADKYAHLFRNGSHWRIRDDEFDRLAGEIRKAGRAYAP
jgi:hypothetical protein